MLRKNKKPEPKSRKKAGVYIGEDEHDFVPIEQLVGKVVGIYLECTSKYTKDIIGELGKHGDFYTITSCYTHNDYYCGKLLMTECETVTFHEDDAALISMWLVDSDEFEVIDGELISMF